MFSTTVPNRQQRRAASHRGRTSRHIATVTLAVAISFAAGCGAAEEQVTGAPAPAVPELDSAWQARIERAEQEAVQARVAAAAGSDRHLQNLADQAVQARVAAAAGSDRHLQNLADQAVQARVAAAAGSDRHLENLAADVAVEARVASAAGSDRHLENLAAEAQDLRTQDEVRRSDYFSSVINRR